MLFHRSLLTCTFGLLLAGRLMAAEPETSKAATDKDPLTPEAQTAVEELRKTLPADSEALVMLDHILSGSRLGPGEGWFSVAKSQTRFDWETTAKRFDKNSDGAIVADEFLGSNNDFLRLDKNGDRVVTSADFDWSVHSLEPTSGFQMFFAADRDANGKVTRDEFSGLFVMLDSGQRNYLSIDDLKDAFPPPSPAQYSNRPDRPSRSTLVLGLKRQEIGSHQSGPQLNETAPDFTLTTLSGDEVTLSKLVGDKPVVLIFGNFTCGPFRSQSGNIEKLYERYKDRAQFYLVYVREAHPTDGWWMTSNQRAGIELSQPQTNEQRREVAQVCRNHLDLKLPFLVDTVDDKVGATYSGMPNRQYLIDRQGKVAFKNGRGPFGFHPRELEQALLLLLNSSESARASAE